MPWHTHKVQNSGVTHPWDQSEPGSCPHCGILNDPFYQYCRNCIRQLPVRRET